MSLQFILGGSGSGKSYVLYQEIIKKSIENPQVNYIIIVPEQFTMQTQKKLVSMHPGKGIMNIDILSFQRLAYRIFDEIGGNKKLVLEDTGKSLVLRKIAGEKSEDLKILGKNLKKPGYINEIKSIISEFSQYGVSTEQVDKLVMDTKNKPSLSYKLKDISILYKEFRTYLKDKYITAEEILEILCQVVEKSKLVTNSIIAFDGFTGFTPIQYNLIEKLMKLSKKLVITVTIDAKENPYEKDGEHKLFHLSKKTIQKISLLAKNEGVLKEEDIVLQDKVSYRHKGSPALAWLERHLFRYSKEVYEEEQNALHIHCCKNPLEETKFLGREIKRLVREENYRYKDIAIITGDMERYSHYVEKIFGDYQIPCFVDNKRNILQNPFVEFLRASLEVIEEDFSYDSVFRYLRSGLSALEEDEIDILENYVIALGIRGYHKWQEPWTRTYKKMGKNQIENMNEYKEVFLKEVATLREELKRKGATVEDYTRALYDFMVLMEMQTKLADYEERFQSENRGALAKEYGQIYGILLGLADKFIDLLGEEVLTIKEYKEVLEAGLKEANVGVIPPGIDQVLMGDMERTRLEDIKVLFVAGVNDGMIPKALSKGGILSELERESLAEKKVELAPTARENAFIQKFYLYLNLTKPQDYLYLTLSKSDSNGSAIRPSYLVDNITKMYDGIMITDEEDCVNPIERIVTAENGVEFLIDGLRNYKKGSSTREWEELYSWYYRDEKWRKPLRNLVKAAYYTNTEKGLSRATAKALYGTTLENSATRLEKYAACAFAHFLDYGLELSERIEYEFEAIDMGNIFHETLEGFSKKLEESPYTWFDLPDRVRDEMIDHTIEEAVREEDNHILYSSARNKYIINRIRRIMKRSVWALGEQIKVGRFKPDKYEVSFSAVQNLEAVNIMLSEDEKIKLKGRIDRVDKYEDENGVYVKIIDYKSGNTTFDLLALYYGLQLQLVVYMNAAMEMEQKLHPGKKIIPAGIFYYNIKDPILKTEDPEDLLEVQNRLKEQLKMNGLVNSDKEIITMLDETIEKKSMVIPVSFNANGSISKNSSVAKGEQFQIISNYVNHKIKEIGSEILEGHIEVEPYELGDKKACDYCAYSAVCGFDLKTPGYNYRRLKKNSDEELWEKLNDLNKEKQGEEE